MTSGDQSDLQRGLADAEALRRSGAHEQAHARLTQLQQQFPDSGEVCFRLGQIAANRGDLSGCRESLTRAVDSDGQNAVYQVRLGNVCERIGDNVAAIAAYEAAIRVDPRQIPALLRLVHLYLDVDRRDAAVDIAQRIVLIQGPVAPVLNDPRLPAPLRQALQQVRGLLREKYQSLIRQTKDYVDARHQPADLARLHLALEQIGQPPATSQPLHGPEFLYYPGLDDRPWFDTAAWDWVDPLRQHWQDIRDEFIALSRTDSAFKPYIVKGNVGHTLQGTDFTSLAGNRDWSSFHLNKAGWNAQQCAKVPKTAAIVKDLPLADAEAYMPEVFFSVLAPGTDIVPHFGQTNIRLTMHLGLVIPPDCGIRVGDETRTWREGEVLAFDDSFEHTAWNHSQSERVVLILESWHPDLTAPEIDGLQHFFSTRASWLSRFDDLNLVSGSHS